MERPTGRLKKSMFVGAVFLLAACGGGGGGASTADASLRDFEIDLSEDSLSAGEVTFSVNNEGPSVHEFVVVEAGDYQPDGLPTDDSGAVIEDDVTVVDELEDIAVGSDEDLTVDLQAGDYIVFCNIDGHYSDGMNAGFTVG